MSRSAGSRDACARMNFIPFTLSGAFPAMPAASLSTTASSSASGTTRFTSPSACASSAEIWRPVNISSFARQSGT